MVTLKKVLEIFKKNYNKSQVNCDTNRFVESDWGSNVAKVPTISYANAMP